MTRILRTVRADRVVSPRRYNSGEYAPDPGYVPPAPAWKPSRARLKRMAERASSAPRRAVCNGPGCKATALQDGSSLCVNCARRETLVTSMALVLRYETEWALTGEVWKDEDYLTAKEFIARWAGAL